MQLPASLRVNAFQNSGVHADSFRGIVGRRRKTRSGGEGEG